MPSKERYQEALKKLRKAHEAHRRRYEQARRRLGAPRQAHEAAQSTREEFHKQMGLFYTGFIEPLREPSFAGRSSAIDDVIAFLSVEEMAFGTGYAKEWYYKKLKRFELSREQIEQVKAMALARCASQEYRREDTELRRLMGKLADLEFLEKVAAIPARVGSRVEKHKMSMLQMILLNRKDLRQAASIDLRQIRKS